jgi:hypothetical protein
LRGAGRGKTAPAGTLRRSNFCMEPCVLRNKVTLFTISIAFLFVRSASSQTTPVPSQGTAGGANRAIATQTAPATEELPKRLFFIIPNHHSHPSLSESKPLRVKEKFALSARDSFDPGNFALVGMFAGVGQLTNSVKSYGQGAEGYAKYYGAAYGDLMIGNVMTESVFPSLFHQDPRYFRRGSGSTWSRLGYAMGQIFVTHGDNRKTQVNFSELAGNATAVAISNAYNPARRTAADAAAKFGLQLGLDMAGNVMKEFVPDIYRKFSHKHSSGPSHH